MVAVGAVTAEPLSASARHLPILPLSKPIREHCERHASDWQCEKLQKFVLNFAAERYDRTWASGMELRIARAVEVNDRGVFMIRALECHSDRCALEVGSYVRRYSDLGGDKALQADLHQQTAIDTSEMQPGGVPLMISLRTYARPEVAIAEWQAEQAAGR